MGRVRVCRGEGEAGVWGCKEMLGFAWCGFSSAMIASNPAVSALRLFFCYNSDFICVFKYFDEWMLL